jgi:hypothetical protein
VNATAQKIVGGILGIALIALIITPQGTRAIRNFFGGFGYDIGVAGAPVTGHFPTYPV